MQRGRVFYCKTFYRKVLNINIFDPLELRTTFNSLQWLAGSSGASRLGQTPFSVSAAVSWKLAQNDLKTEFSFASTLQVFTQ